jgi:hypothetical protein
LRGKSKAIEAAAGLLAAAIGILALLNVTGWGDRPSGPLRLPVIHGLPRPAPPGKHRIDPALEDADGTVPPTAVGGQFTSHGMRMNLYLSDAYRPDHALLQSFADFFTALPQHGDADGLTVYLTSATDAQHICDADACYLDDEHLIVMPVRATEDTDPLPELAAHEFAHRIASRRSNYPWDAADNGPKRWATMQQVCGGVRSGRLFPGDENAHYEMDPVEAWAEVYRVAVGGNAKLWDSVDDSFIPDAAKLKAALADATAPWPGNSSLQVKLIFRSGAASRQTVAVHANLDGRVSVSAKAGDGLDVSLAILDSRGRWLSRKSPAHATATHVSADVCGSTERTATVVVNRSRGDGEVALSISSPG